jgi:hypothetical protein
LARQEFLSASTTLSSAYAPRRLQLLRIFTTCNVLTALGITGHIFPSKSISDAKGQQLCASLAVPALAWCKLLDQQVLSEPSGGHQQDIEIIETL